MLDAALKERVLASAKAQPSPTRAQARSRETALMALAVAVSLAGFALARGASPGEHPFSSPFSSPLFSPLFSPLLWMVESAVGGLALFAVAWWVAFGRSRTMLARAPWVYRASLALTPYALFFWTWAMELRRAEARPAGQGVTHLVREATLGAGRCAALILLVAIPPLLALARLRRDSEPARAGAIGAATGVALGAGAWLLVDLDCSVGGPKHLLLGHVLPVMALGLAGEALGRWLMALRGPVVDAAAAVDFAPHSTPHDPRLP